MKQDNRENKLSDYSIYRVYNHVTYIVIEVKLSVGASLTAADKDSFTLTTGNISNLICLAAVMLAGLVYCNSAGQYQLLYDEEYIQDELTTVARTSYQLFSQYDIGAEYEFLFNHQCHQCITSETS